MVATNDTTQTESSPVSLLKRLLRYLYRDMRPKWLEDDIKADIARHKAKGEDAAKLEQDPERLL